MEEVSGASEAKEEDRGGGADGDGGNVGRMDDVYW